MRLSITSVTACPAIFFVVKFKYAVMKRNTSKDCFLTLETLFPYRINTEDQRINDIAENVLPFGKQFYSEVCKCWLLPTSCLFVIDSEVLFLFRIGIFFTQPRVTFFGQLQI